MGLARGGGSARALGAYRNDPHAGAGIRRDVCAEHSSAHWSGAAYAAGDLDHSRTMSAWIGCQGDDRQRAAERVAHHLFVRRET